jgi:uncharacterized protein YjdB
MRVVTLSRVVAAFAVLTLAAACDDTSGPGGQIQPGGGGLSIVPRSATIKAGQTMALQASLIDENGDRLSGVPFQWTSTNDAVATVAATGEVLGRSEGHVVITASALGKSQVSTIQVLPRQSKPEPAGKPKAKAVPK